VVSEGVLLSIAGNGDGDDNQRRANLKQRMMELRNSIAKEPDNPVNARRLLQLYFMQIDEDPDNSLGERVNIMNLIKSKKDSYRNYKFRSGWNKNKGIRWRTKTKKELAIQLTGEVSMVIEVFDLIRDGMIEKAYEKINEYKPLIENDDMKREILFEEFDVLTKMRRYDQAKGVIEELREVVKIDKESLPGYTPPDLTALEEYLKDMMEMDSLDYEPYKNIEKKIVTINIPVEFALKPAYPNPFNPVTTIPFELPEESKVRTDVYDILGRRVVELTNSVYTAGYHNITLDGANLASGVYIVRAEMISMKDNSRHSFIRKVMLLK